MEINKELLVEEGPLCKALLFFMEQQIDWEELFDLKPEQYRQSQIIIAKLTSQELVDIVKNEDGSTKYLLNRALYGTTNRLIDIDLFYDLFSNKNLGKMLNRKVNKNHVEELMIKFLSENKEILYEQIVQQTKLFIEQKVSMGEADFVPKAENFIYKKDANGEIIGSPLLDLMNDPIQNTNYGLL